MSRKPINIHINTHAQSGGYSYTTPVDDDSKRHWVALVAGVTAVIGLLGALLTFIVKALPDDAKPQGAASPSAAAVSAPLVPPTDPAAYAPPVEELSPEIIAVRAAEKYFEDIRAGDWAAAWDAQTEAYHEWKSQESQVGWWRDDVDHTTVQVEPGKAVTAIQSTDTHVAVRVPLSYVKTDGREVDQVLILQWTINDDGTSLLDHLD